MIATSPVPAPRTATSTSTARLRQGAQPTSPPTATRGSSTPAGFWVREVPPSALTQLNVLPSARGAVASALPLVKAAASVSMYLAGWVTPLPSMRRVPGHSRRADGPDGHDSFRRAAGWLGMPLNDGDGDPGRARPVQPFRARLDRTEWASIGGRPASSVTPSPTKRVWPTDTVDSISSRVALSTGRAAPGAYARHHPLMFSKTQ